MLTISQRQLAARLAEECFEEEQARSIAAKEIFEMAFPTEPQVVLCSCRWRKDGTGLESARQKREAKEKKS